MRKDIELERFNVKGYRGVLVFPAKFFTKSLRSQGKVSDPRELGDQ